MEEIEGFFEQTDALRAEVLGGYDDTDEIGGAMEAARWALAWTTPARRPMRPPSGGNAALDHVLSVHSNALGTADLLERKIRARRNVTGMPTSAGAD